MSRKTEYKRLTQPDVVGLSPGEEALLMASSSGASRLVKALKADPTFNARISPKNPSIVIVEIHSDSDLDDIFEVAGNSLQDFTQLGKLTGDRDEESSFILRAVREYRRTQLNHLREASEETGSPKVVEIREMPDPTSGSPKARILGAIEKSTGKLLVYEPVNSRELARMIAEDKVEEMKLYFPKYKNLHAVDANHEFQIFNGNQFLTASDMYYTHAEAEAELRRRIAKYGMVISE